MQLLKLSNANLISAQIGEVILPKQSLGVLYNSGLARRKLIPIYRSTGIFRCRKTRKVRVTTFYHAYQFLKERPLSSLYSDYKNKHTKAGGGVTTSQTNLPRMHCVNRGGGWVRSSPPTLPPPAYLTLLFRLSTKCIFTFLPALPMAVNWTSARDL